MKTGLIAATAFALLCTDTAASPSAGGEITLFASNAINAILTELVPRFEAASGHKVTMGLDYAALLRYLTAPDAIAVLQRRGVEPVPTE
jgi:ABC-type molybdate transport system substrate-binding protein